uniref:Uncharacterized protein n=1 Tax=Trypanosoma congolense (strain IL3000) TaxID=1068625 RepID=G0UV04_TRYCI|nr:hypothetical protein, unlikely [Trypanosoma congolense IL3000]
MSKVVVLPIGPSPSHTSGTYTGSPAFTLHNADKKWKFHLLWIEKVKITQYNSSSDNWNFYSCPFRMTVAHPVSGRCGHCNTSLSQYLSTYCRRYSIKAGGSTTRSLEQSSNLGTCDTTAACNHRPRTTPHVIV